MKHKKFIVNLITISFILLSFNYIVLEVKSDSIEIFGDDTGGHSGTFIVAEFLHDRMVGRLSSPSSSGYADNITAYLSGYATNCRAAIYWNENMTLMASTVEIAYDGTPDWWVFDFETEPYIENGVEYFLVLYGSDTPNKQYLYVNGATSGSNTVIYESVDDYPNWETPWSGYTEDNSAEMAIYCSYTEWENSPPEITSDSENPLNESINVGLLLDGNYSMFNITVSDVDDDTQNMDMTWRTNESGVWADMGTNNSISNGTYYCINNSWVDSYSTIYWWSVNVTDNNGGWINETYHFTTIINHDPVVTPSSENPPDSSTEVDFNLSNFYNMFNITISDVDDDIQDMDIYWMTNESGTWQIMSTNISINNGTYYCTNVSWFDKYNEDYYWSVNVTDNNGGWDNETFKFHSVTPEIYWYYNISCPSNSFGWADNISFFNVNWSFIENNTNYTLIFNEDVHNEMLTVNFSEAESVREYNYTVCPDEAGDYNFSMRFDSGADNITIDDVNHSILFNYSGEALVYNYSDIYNMGGGLVIDYDINSKTLNFTVNGSVDGPTCIVLDPFFGWMYKRSTLPIASNTSGTPYNYTYGHWAEMPDIDNVAYAESINVGFGYVAQTATYQCALYEYGDYSSTYAWDRILLTESKVVQYNEDNKVITFNFEEPFYLVPSAKYYMVVAMVSPDSDLVYGYTNTIKAGYTGYYYGIRTVGNELPANLSGETSYPYNIYMYCEYNIVPSIVDGSEIPANESVDISVTPVVSVNTSDDGSIINAVWSSNSSGSWQDFGTNSSIYGYGAISDGETDKYTWDAQEGRYPSVLRLEDSDYYVIACNGNAGAEYGGYLRTLQVSNITGDITDSVIDTYEYYDGSGYYSSIVHVYGDIYAVCFYNAETDTLNLSTFEVWANNGSIRKAVVDNFVLNSSYTNTVSMDMEEQSPNHYSIIHGVSGVVNRIIIDTIYIDNNGDIASSKNDSKFQSFQAFISLCSIFCDSDTLAVVGRNSATIGEMFTIDITEDGDIADAHTEYWQFETSSCYEPVITKINDTVYCMVYGGGSNNQLMVRTLTITDGGDIQGWIDTEVSLSINYNHGSNRIVYMGNNLYTIMTREGGGYANQLYFYTVNITPDGTISSYGMDYQKAYYSTDNYDILYEKNLLNIGNGYILAVYPGYYAVRGYSATFKIGNESTTYISQSFDNATEAGTTYYWRVNLTDGISTTYEIFHFTTAGELEETPGDIVLIHDDYDSICEYYKTWKESTTSYEVTYIDIDDITSNNSFWVNGSWGDNNASNPYYESQSISNYEDYNDSSAQLRNYIRYIVYTYNTDYVIFVGKVYIPTRNFTYYNSEYESPFDEFYFGCLNGTQRPQDTIWEIDAYNNNISDMEIDVIIGRFPSDNPTELYNMINKTMSYASIDSDSLHARTIALYYENLATEYDYDYIWTNEDYGLKYSPLGGYANSGEYIFVNGTGVAPGQTGAFDNCITQEQVDSYLDGGLISIVNGSNATHSEGIVYYDYHTHDDNGFYTSLFLDDMDNKSIPFFCHVKSCAPGNFYPRTSQVDSPLVALSSIGGLACFIGDSIWNVPFLGEANLRGTILLFSQNQTLGEYFKLYWDYYVYSYNAFLGYNFLGDPSLIYPYQDVPVASNFNCDVNELLPFGYVNLSADAYDFQGDTISNISLWTNASGSWQMVDYWTSVASGTNVYNVSYAEFFSLPDTTYYYSWNVTDGTDWWNNTRPFITTSSGSIEIENCSDWYDVSSTPSSIKWEIMNPENVYVDVYTMAYNSSNNTWWQIDYDAGTGTAGRSKTITDTSWISETGVLYKWALNCTIGGINVLNQSFPVFIRTSHDYIFTENLSPVGNDVDVDEDWIVYPSGELWEAIDETTSDYNTTYIYKSGTGLVLHWFEIDNSSLTNANIDFITLNLLTYNDYTNPTKKGYFYLGLRNISDINTSYLIKFDDISANEWRNYTINMTYNPLTGLLWTISDIQNLSIRTGIYDSAIGKGRISQLIISIIYYPTTSVDTITPYNIIDSPLQINATGDSSLDNVSLYYRYSNDNISWVGGHANFHTLHYNNTRWGKIDNNIFAPIENTLLWTMNCTGNHDEFGGPCVHDGIVYMPSKDFDGSITTYKGHKNLTAIYLNNSTIKWVYNMYGTRGSDNTPTYYDGKLYFTYRPEDEYNYLNITCLYAENGTEIWNIQTIGTLSATGTSGSVLIDENNGLAIVNAHGNLSAFYLNNGTLKWVDPSGINQSGANTPALYNGIVYWCTSNTTGENNNTFATYANNGTNIWRQKYVGEVWDSGPLLNPNLGYLYIAREETVGLTSYIKALYMNNGTIAWNSTIKSSWSAHINAIPAFDGESLYFIATYYENDEYLEQSTRLFKVNASTGIEVYNTTYYTGYTIWSTSSPVYSNGYLYTGTWNFTILCFNASDGSLEWSRSVGARVYSQPAIADGILLIGSDNWSLYAIGNLTQYNNSLDNGWILWDNTSNPDTDSPWSWNFDFPNGTGYYEFYSIGKKNTIYESAPDIADASCYYSLLPHIDCEINITTWIIGEINIGTTTTKNFTFWQNGSATIDITIGVTDTNYTYVNYSSWLTLGHNRYCANYTIDNWASENNIEPGYPPTTILKNSFPPGSFYFGIRFWMPRTATYPYLREDFIIVLTVSEST